MKVTPRLFKFLVNFYPPYIGAGVKVTYISEAWDELHASMALRWYNRNAVGTHFGGSLYSMVDPHLMLLLMKLLGKEYLVWDKSADIDFIKASKNKVTAVIKISPAELQEIKGNTAKGQKYFPQFVVDIIDSEGELIAKVNKTLYVRRKKNAN